MYVANKLSQMACAHGSNIYTYIHTHTHTHTQDICREKGVLDGLRTLVTEAKGYTQEKACGAVWCLTLDRANKRRIGIQCSAFWLLYGAVWCLTLDRSNKRRIGIQSLGIQSLYCCFA